MEKIFAEVSNECILHKDNLVGWPLAAEARGQGFNSFCIGSCNMSFTFLIYILDLSAMYQFLSYHLYPFLPFAGL